MQMIVSEKTIAKSGEKGGQEVLRNMAYCSKLNQCFKWLLHRQIRESDAKGYKEVLAEIERIEKEIDLAVTI